MVEKIALASCNGMSPHGLVSRVAVGDCKKENECVEIIKKEINKRME